MDKHNISPTLFNTHTSESVSNGHPDKIADQISDAILDAVLALDPKGLVACETLVKTGMVLVAGEMTTEAWVDVESIARETIKQIGYNHADMGFDWESCAVLSAIGKQSKDIARGVLEHDDNLGAGDQGIMFGYACDETASYMPAPIAYAHKLMEQQTKVRCEKILPWLRPDAKAQITLRYQDDQPVSADTIVVSTQHDPDITNAQIQEAVIEEIIKPVIPTAWLADTKFLINPTGRFVIGGPLGDCGLTGRKIIVDSYGGMAKHGGGCFSGKDPTKVDRSGAYIARYAAKQIVASKLAKRCEIRLSYAIGVVEPIAIDIETFGTETVPVAAILQLITKSIDFTPKGIIDFLELRRPIYQQTAAFGHFGRDDLSLPWERLLHVEQFSSLR